MNPVYDSASQLDTPIQHWDREWWNNSCDCHHNLLHYNATAFIIGHMYVTDGCPVSCITTFLLWSFLICTMNCIYLKRPLCPCWFITAFCLHVAVRHLSNTPQPGWFTMTLSSVCQYWVPTVTTASGSFYFLPVDAEQTSLQSHGVNHLKRKNTE